MPTKIEKLKIEKGDDKTIPKEGLEIDIKPYTVLIGENNSGKTKRTSLPRARPRCTMYTVVPTSGSTSPVATFSSSWPSRP